MWRLPTIWSSLSDASIIPFLVVVDVLEESAELGSFVPVDKIVHPESRESLRRLANQELAAHEELARESAARAATGSQEVMRKRWREVMKTEYDDSVSSSETHLQPEI